MNFKLDAIEIKELEQLHKGMKDRKLADRVKAVVALSKGYSFKQIHEILLLDERSARRYFKTYKKRGIDELLNLAYKGRESKLNLEQETQLINHLETNVYSTAASIAKYIEKKYQITYTNEGLVQTLHRLGFSYKKTKIIPAKADKQKQEDFIKMYKELRENQKSDEKVYFIDGVHPTHNVMPAYGWIKKGTDKEVKSNTGRERININGAYSPNDNDIIIRKDESINSQSTIELFKMIEEKNKDKNKIYIIADNAKYYKSKIIKEYLECNPKIEIIHLPSYSPNLNLIERLWKFFKKKVMYNKYYEKVNDFEKAIDNFFNYEIKSYTDDIKRLLVEKFHLFNTS